MNNSLLKDIIYNPQGINENTFSDVKANLLSQMSLLLYLFSFKTPEAA